MKKRFISVFIIGILACSIFGCAKTVEETSVAEAETVETDHTETVSKEETESISDAAEQEKQAADSPMPQEEPEPKKEIDFDGSDTHRSILEEYERAWEDETYTVEEWQDVAGVFMTLTNSKWVGWSAEHYTLYYSISDLSGDGTEELIIEVQGEDGIAPCFLYTCDGERMHMTDSRTGSDLVNKPTILYENGIIESTEYIKYGMYRYNFYQRPEVLRDQGGMKLIDLYFYIEDPENGTQYYKGDMTNIITEEEFWSAINEYESLPQVELNWHELDGFWESDEDAAMTPVIGEEYSQREKEELEEESESAAIEDTALKEEAEAKNNEPITIMTKVTYYHGDDPDRWSELKYDSAGNLLGWQYYNADGNFRGWKEYEYDSTGNLMSTVTHHGNGSGYRTWHEYEYDSNGNKTRDTEYDEYSGYDDPRAMKEYEYDSEGNLTKMIEHEGENWYRTEYEYITIIPQ